MVKSNSFHLNNSNYYLLYSFVKKNSKDTDSDSTADSNRPSYMDKFEIYNKIISDLEAKCK